MKKITLLLCFLALVTGVSAQTRVSGTVKDSKGEPVVGAVVMVKGDSRTGTVVDLDGKYTIEIPAGAGKELTANSIGYKTTTLSFAGKSVLDFVLADDAELLDEVVVVGYGAMRRSDLTGAVTSVKIDEENAAKSTTLDQMLEGRAAGVQIISDNSSPDSGITVRVRGLSTFSGDVNPLYVVDGVIINGTSESPKTIAEAMAQQAYREEINTNPLAGINPQDIASMEILKDASATAIYGSQGANGVVLITTKQANKDKPVVNFNAGVTVSHASKLKPIMSFDQFVDYLESVDGTSVLSKIYEDPSTRTGLKVTPIDWQDYVTRVAVSQRYYFSVSGRPNGFNYFFSAGYNRTQGVLKGTDSRAFTSRLNLSKDFNKYIKLSFKSTFGYTNSDLVNGGGNIGTTNTAVSIMASILRCKPYIYKNPEMEIEEDPDLADADSENKFNPMRTLDGVSHNSKRFRFTPSLTLDAKILKWLSFRSTFGADVQYTKTIKTKDHLMSNGFGTLAGVGENNSVFFNWDNLLMVNKSWGKHSLNATLGQSASRRESFNQSMSANLLPQKYAWGADINEATSSCSYIPVYEQPSSSLMSFFGRAIYNFDERYVLTATVRFDGSSKFLGANKWGIFPSVAFAWRIVSEPWFNVPVISNAKLRLGWGQVGNQNIGNYLTAPVYTTSATLGNHYTDSHKESGLYQSNIVNRALKWETTNQINAGLDVSFFKGRLAFTADFYDKRTFDLLQSKTVASHSGVSTIAINDGSINNRGFEFSVDAVPVKTKDFEWSLGANIAMNRNKLVSVGASGTNATIYFEGEEEGKNVSYFLGSGVFSATLTKPINIFVEGYPMGMFYGYVWDGIVQEGEESTAPKFNGTARQAGQVKYKDMNGDGNITAADYAVIGNPHPDFTYGINTSFSFKRLTLTMNFTGVQGVDIANMNNFQGFLTSSTKNCLYPAVAGAWTTENKSNIWPKLNAAQDTDAFCARFIEDGSYFRMSNISLGYSFPMNKANKVLHGLNLSISCTNPFICTKYTGYSPLVNSTGSNVKRIGVDVNSAPYPRSYNLDLKFTF